MFFTNIIIIHENPDSIFYIFITFNHTHLIIL